jgi:hypothetical protein
LAEHHVQACEGIGVVVPGMVEHSTMRIVHAPTLWRQNAAPVIFAEPSDATLLGAVTLESLR